MSALNRAKHRRSVLACHVQKQERRESIKMLVNVTIIAIIDVSTYNHFICVGAGIG